MAVEAHMASDASVQGGLEFVAQVEEEVGLLRVVAIAEAGTDGAEDGVVVVSYLSAEEGAVVEDFLQFVCLLTCGKAEKHVVVMPYSLLCL